MNYAEVYLDIKTLEVDHPFDYRVPHELSNHAFIGSVVSVPFGSRREIGYIAKIKDRSNVPDEEIKPIEKIIGQIQIFNRDKLKLIHWMSAYYVAPIGKVIDFFLPPGTKKEIAYRLENPERFFKYKSIVYIDYNNYSLYNKNISWKKNYSQKRIIDLLLKSNGIDLKDLLKDSKASMSSLKSLLNKGILYMEKERVRRNNIYGFDADIKEDLTDLKFEESLLFNEVSNCISNKKFKGFLLQEFSDLEQIKICEQLCNIALKHEKKTILLIPEAITASKIYSRFSSQLQEKICVYHSEMNDSSRLEKWFDTFFNKHYIIIGTRSAIFLPVNNLGLVLVYEESDPSYKESTMIRYNTLDVALRLGRILKIPVVFGSIAPSIKTRYYSENNSSIEIIKPSVSIIGKYLVEKKVVDLKVVDRFKEDINITNILYRAIKEEIEKKNKIVIFMNKRGYSSFLICKSCGNIPRCPQCNISYAYHQRDGKLVCHHCTKSETFHGFCSYCGSSNLSFQGTGIEKVESKLAQRFVNIEIYRLDSDTVKHKKTLQELIFNFKSKSPAILLGTQMIAKEIELDNATLLAVIDFDNMFYLPDFHNYERAFLLLNQLLLLIKNTDKSRFIIQAYNTQNIALQSFIVGGYNDFYTRELSNRMELSYPPFSKLINIIVSGRDESRVISDIERLEKEINKVARVDFSMLGPSRAPFYKINQFYRWHLLVKTNSALRFNMGLAKIIKDFKKDENNKIITDVDPVWIL